MFFILLVYVLKSIFLKSLQNTKILQNIEKNNFYEKEQQVLVHALFATFAIKGEKGFC